VTPGYTPETTYPKATRAEVRFRHDGGSDDYRTRAEADTGSIVCRND
jgi:hypothetical protein